MDIMVAWLTRNDLLATFLFALLFGQPTNGADCSSENCRPSFMPGNNAKPAKRFQTIDSELCCIVGMLDIVQLMSDGAMLDDYCKPPPPKTTTSTTKMTTLSETVPPDIEPPSDSTIESTTTEPPPNLIKCTKATWVPVEPAPVAEIYDGHRIVEDYAIRIGFHQYKGTFRPDHIAERIKEIVGVAANDSINNGDEELGEEVRKWTSENGQWIQRIPMGTFQYFRVPDDLINAKIMMLMRHCDFGKFLLAPVKLRPNLANNNEKVDWANDFSHLEGCKRRLRDHTRNDPLDDRDFVLGDERPVKIVKHVQVGTSTSVPLDKAKLEAHKYKYGYTDPLRRSEFAEYAKNWSRVRYWGRFLMPIEEAYQPPHLYRIKAIFKTIEKKPFLTNKGYALSGDEYCRKPCDPSKDRHCRIFAGTDLCLKCLIDDCNMWIECRLIQVKFLCDGFNISMPRFQGRQIYKVSKNSVEKTKYFLDRVSYYGIIGTDPHDSYREIQVPFSYGKYKLYEIADKKVRGIP